MASLISVTLSRAQHPLDKHLDFDKHRYFRNRDSLNVAGSRCEPYIMNESRSDPEDSNPKCGSISTVKHFKQHYSGMCFAMLASLLFSYVSVLVKVLEKQHGFSAECSSFWRYAGITVLSVPFILFFDKYLFKEETRSVFEAVRPFRQNWRVIAELASAGLLGGMAVILRYFAMEYLSIGDTYVISYSSPIMVTILAHFILHERTGLIPICAASLSLIGVLVITQPPVLTGKDTFDTNSVIGTAFASGSMMCSAFFTIVARKLRKVHLSVMLLVIGALGMTLSFAMSEALHSFSFPRGLQDGWIVTGVAILSCIGQIAIISALKFEEAGPVSLIRNCDVIFAYVFQLIFLGISPSIYSAVGGSIVFCGILIMALRRYVSTLPSNSGCRMGFSFLLH